MIADIDLVKKIASQMRSKSQYLVTAESCTGGLLGHIITNLPGASDFYLGGQITYSNEAKQYWLGVPQETLDTYGAVSKETVLSMAHGIRIAFSSTTKTESIVGLSISGIAGPAGGSPEKPVGTVWIGISMAGYKNAYNFQFEGNRESIKQQSAHKALEIILEVISAK